MKATLEASSKPVIGCFDFVADDGGVAVIVPAPDCGLTVEEIAAKDVPEGKPFKIVHLADIPEDRIFRDAWEWAE